MNVRDVLKELRAAGTAQNRKVYSRHGVDREMFGVSFANLKKLKKRIKVDHELAEQLWTTGNHDARILATMVADPSAVTKQQLERWARELDNYVITDALSAFVSQSPHACDRMEKWAKSKGEWIGSAGWNLLAHIAMADEGLPDKYFEAHLSIIEKGIHSQQNRVRYSMNSALIAIGIRNAKLKERALKAASKIGEVVVDHGETGCKTPNAAEYIAKSWKRKR